MRQVEESVIWKVIDFLQNLRLENQEEEKFGRAVIQFMLSLSFFVSFRN